MASNGRLPASMLAPIPGGRLRKDAAAAWNAGPAKAGCRPLGPNSSYRDYSGQVYFWNLYTSGRGNLAARPGTSNHGLGVAVDLAAQWMRTWIDKNGRRYGWAKTEAPSEWWHVCFTGSWSKPKPPPNPITKLPRHLQADASKLMYHRRMAIQQAKSGKGPKYRKHVKWRDHYRREVAKKHKKAKGQNKNILRRVLKDRDGKLPLPK